MLRSISVCLFLINLSQGFLLSRKECYGDLGCFSTDPPFRSIQRPIVLLPDIPEKIGTRFYLYTRLNEVNKQVIVAGQKHTLQGTNHNASLPITFIVHGFTHNSDEPWVIDMIGELLKHADSNVFSVDWRGGSGLPYTQATGNTRVVGAEIAKMIKFLTDETGIFPTVHIIGHSLGAHIGGYAGERLEVLGLSKLDRITGLDPTEPFFQGTDPLVRLDATDATFVDVIHSDAGSIVNLGLGMSQAVGHVDVYPNGGKSQPGCPHGIISKGWGGVWSLYQIGLYGAKAAVACSHERSYYYFTESINSACPMISYPCTEYDLFEQGKCISCADDRCQVMGYHANKLKATGKFYLNTASKAPYCSWHYLVALKVSADQVKSNWGKVEIGLVGSNGQTPMMNFTEPETVVNPGDRIIKLVSTPIELGSIQAVRIHFTKVSSLLWGWKYQDNLKVDKIQTYKGQDASINTVCGKGTPVFDTGTMKFDISPPGSC